MTPSCSHVRDIATVFPDLLLIHVATMLRFPLYTLTLIIYIKQSVIILIIRTFIRVGEGRSICVQIYSRSCD